MSTYAPARGGARANTRRRTPHGRRNSPAARPAPKAVRASELEQALDAAAAIPVTAADFPSLGLPETAVAGLSALRITTPTDVQTRTIPDALTGRDVLGRAQTGSGKTLAFGLPLLVRLSRRSGRTKARHPRALVVVPTRELAQQVADALNGVASRMSLSVTAIYGGAPMNRQVRALQRGADVVVATPGRLEDHLRRGTCSLDDVAVTVLDEADHMADLGFLPAVTRILDAVPADSQRLLFSATLDRGVERVAREYLTDPAIHAASVVGDVATMSHHAFGVSSEHKIEVASRIAGRGGRTLVFVRTKHGADRLAKQLSRNGVATEVIHGNRSQAQRRRALEDFSSGRRPVLVATDVAARGIHVDEVDLVVHFDPPADHKDYMHRSGRTARAGRSGVVLSLLLPHERSGHRRMSEHLQSDHSVVVVDPHHPAVAELAVNRSGG